VGILAGRIELGILAPANGIGFPFSDKEQPKVFPTPRLRCGVMVEGEVE
jgi:hypothetical protein